MARKYVRFNYFEPFLVPARIALEEDLMELDEQEQEVARGGGDRWDMRHFLDFIAVPRQNFLVDYQIGDEIAEIEPGSFIYNDQHNIYSLQLSKLRDKNIPSKKRVGEIREDILLNQNEYIGEFVSIIYDEEISCLMIQSNLYGLSTKQIENYFTELRFRHLNYIGNEDDEPFVVKLRPKMDHRKIYDALQADYYRKIRIRTADYMEDALMDENSLISDARRTLMQARGASIDLQISLGRAERSASLDSEQIRRVLREFRELPPGSKPNIELTMLEKEEAEIETINLIEPRMTDRISLEVEPRQTIGHEYLFYQMLHKYLERRNDLRRTMVE